MAVRIRLKKMGRIHRPFFRIAAVDQRKPRDGAVIEELGLYDPIEKQEDKQLVLNKERVEYWLKVGAQPSEAVHSLLRRGGILTTPYRQPAKAKK